MNEKTKKPKPLQPNDVMKYEIAAELGYINKIAETGWRSLTAKESGKIGGMLAKRRKALGQSGIDANSLAVAEEYFQNEENLENNS